MALRPMQRWLLAFASAAGCADQGSSSIGSDAGASALDVGWTYWTPATRPDAGPAVEIPVELTECATQTGTTSGGFVEKALAVGLEHRHGFLASTLRDAVTSPYPEVRVMHFTFTGGLAAGDYDDDCRVDLFAVGGDSGPNHLFHNRGSRFSLVEGSELDLVSTWEASAFFGDLDGDGDLDLLLGLIDQGVMTFRQVAGRFEDARADWPFRSSDAGPGRVLTTFSASQGDYDLDGDLDTLLTHWGSVDAQGLWQNTGGKYAEVSRAAGLLANRTSPPFPFTPNFADADSDRRPDLLLASDFGTSRVFLNRGPFVDATDPDVVTDEFGMGATVGDFDNDGDLDWFVSSIWAPPGAPMDPIRTGNRLYRGFGDGRFEEVSGEARVREGYWAWATCTQDFDNDGRLDVFHVSGHHIGPLAFERPITGVEMYDRTPARLFMNVSSAGELRFEERSEALGIDDRDHGRGISCFDYERDGDIDVVISTNGGPLKLYENQLSRGHFLGVILRGPPPNHQAVGARVWVTTQGGRQLRELRAGSNYASQDPTEAHFGLGSYDRVEELVIEWPAVQGHPFEVTRMQDVSADRWIVVARTGE